MAWCVIPAEFGAHLGARLVHTLARSRREIGFGVFLLIASGRSSSA
jgi:hypothetical protein